MVVILASTPPLMTRQGELRLLPSHAIVASLARGRRHFTVCVHEYAWFHLGETEIIEMPEPEVGDQRRLIGRRYPTLVIAAQAAHIAAFGERSDKLLRDIRVRLVGHLAWAWTHSITPPALYGSDRTAALLASQQLFASHLDTRANVCHYDEPPPVLHNSAMPREVAGQITQDWFAIGKLLPIIPAALSSDAGREEARETYDRMVLDAMGAAGLAHLGKATGKRPAEERPAESAGACPSSKKIVHNRGAFRLSTKEGSVVWDRKTPQPVTAYVVRACRDVFARPGQSSKEVLVEPLGLPDGEAAAWRRSSEFSTCNEWLPWVWHTVRPQLVEDREATVRLDAVVEAAFSQYYHHIKSARKTPKQLWVFIMTELGGREEEPLPEFLHSTS